MAKVNIASKWSELPPWAKGVTAIVGAGVLIALGLTAKNFIQEYLKNAEDKKTVGAAKSELKTLAAAGIKPTYKDTQYKIWADAADQCYQGIGTCTGDTIFKNLKNDADLLKLIEAFGVRNISSGIFLVPDSSGDLAKIMRSELSANDLNAINDQLAKQGITYKF